MQKNINDTRISRILEDSKNLNKLIILYFLKDNMFYDGDGDR